MASNIYCLENMQNISPGSIGQQEEKLCKIENPNH
jgi:hypothetical protein